MPKKFVPNVPTCSREEVILDSSPVSKKNKCSKKNVNPAVAWCFTLNNYTEEDINMFRCSIEQHCKVGFFNKEVGKKCGTPHLQGYIEFKKKNRPLSVFTFNLNTHWECARTCKDTNFKYCSKDACGDPAQMTYVFGKVCKKPLRVIEKLRGWQRTVADLIDEEFIVYNDRIINWVCDVEGCSGKTQFCKWLYTKYDQVMIITGGAYKDIACVLNGCEEDSKFDLNDNTVIVFNIPRDADDQGMISYKALESLKDGLMTSTKYESKTKVFNSPVVWVFSNNEPELEKLTKDRWQLWTIVADQLVPHVMAPKKKVCRL